MWQRNYHGLAGTRRVSGCDAEMVAKVLSRTKITCGQHALDGYQHCLVNAHG